MYIYLHPTHPKIKKKSLDLVEKKITIYELYETMVLGLAEMNDFSVTYDRALKLVISSFFFVFCSSM